MESWQYSCREPSETRPVPSVSADSISRLEVKMSGAQELAVREKQELPSKEEKTAPGRYYVPAADIFETDEALTVILEIPGVQKNNVNVALENDVLRVDAQIDFSSYSGMEPVYTEYNIGHY